MSCPIKVNSNTIELTVLTACYWVLDLLCVKCTTYFSLNQQPILKFYNFTINTLLIVNTYFSGSTYLARTPQLLLLA